jgi:GNAT superfamily N-acetyltransferase
MWRPEDRASEPETIDERDIPALNRLFTEAFTDRYRRDGLAGIRVPPLSAVVWSYAIRLAGEGAMVWRDERGDIVAFNLAHQSGAEGWMGPLAVRPDRQGAGLGRTIVETAIARLRAAGVTTLGLETMPRTIENIGFYSRLGFVPGSLTITVGREVSQRLSGNAPLRLSDVEPREHPMLMRACRECIRRGAPGYDFTREMALTNELELGDTVIVERNGTVEGFGLWHSAPLAEGRGTDEVRLLKLYASSPPIFLELIRAVERCAATLHIRRVAVRLQGRFVQAYETLIARGYDVRWTDLRMTLSEYPEPELAPGEVVLSNWEI